jgi:AcrR family transcriptional regulator
MPKANAVKIGQTARTYHHGDLRTALIDEGLRLLERSDPSALSLRAIARNVGVSAPSVYHHFPDKASLLRALADEGLAQLAKHQAQAAAVGGEDGFTELGRTYVRFALAHPHLFRLVFMHTPMRVKPGTGSPEGSAEWLLRSYARSVLGPDASAESEFVFVVRAWSLVHGLSMLILDAQIEPKAVPGLIEKVIAPDGLHATAHRRASARGVAGTRGKHRSANVRPRR